MDIICVMLLFESDFFVAKHIQHGRSKQSGWSGFGMTTFLLVYMYLYNKL